MIETRNLIERKRSRDRTLAAMAQSSLNTPKKRHVRGFTAAILALLRLASRRNSKTTAAASDEEVKSPAAKAKKLLMSKTMPFSPRRKKNNKKNAREGSDGEEGVWQKAILMGDKCEPLDFSGVIYYDIKGEQLNEIPMRSPRASPLPGYLTRRRE